MYNLDQTCFCSTLKGNYKIRIFLYTVSIIFITSNLQVAFQHVIKPKYFLPTFMFPLLVPF